MSVPNQTLDPKILKSAKEEFLSKGYINASLRDICEKAGVTTGALYKRFSGKEALFEAVLAPTIEDFIALSEATEKQDYKRIEQNEIHLMWEQTEETLKGYVEFLYARYDGFKLLLCCSDGSAYSDFVNTFVLENTKRTVTFMEKAHLKGLVDKIPEEDELHILLTAYWSTLFELIRHDFSKERALKHCGIVAKFFNWKAVFEF